MRMQTGSAVTGLRSLSKTTLKGTTSRALPRRLLKTKPKRGYTQQNLEDGINSLEAGHESLQGRYFHGMAGKAGAEFLGDGHFCGDPAAVGALSPKAPAASSSASGASNPQGEPEDKDKEIDVNTAVKAYEKARVVVTGAEAKKLLAMEEATKKAVAIE